MWGWGMALSTEGPKGTRTVLPIERFVTGVTVRKSVAAGKR